MLSISQLLFLTVLVISRADAKCAWDNCPAYTQDGTVNIHLIPHSHEDMGWLKTVDDYYTGFNARKQGNGVQFIISSIIEALKRNSDRRIVYAEVGYLARWFASRSTLPEEKQDLINLVNNGQLELVGGGWVQPDEAVTHYTDIIDQYSLGLRFLNRTFGPGCSAVKTGWQLDPFGHSLEHGDILRQLGHESIYFAREHVLEHIARENNKTLDYRWFVKPGNENLNLFAHSLYNFYDAPSGMCWDVDCNDQPVIANPKFENYNADEVVSKLKQYVENDRLPVQSHKHVLIILGGDFRYQGAEQYMRNIDNLIKVVRQKSSYNIFYSTPACYTKAVNESGATVGKKYSDGIPYTSSAGDDWCGFYTGKPAQKGLIRESSNLLKTVRAFETASDKVIDAPGMDGSANVEVLERAQSLAQHHDAITGTSPEHVTWDYNKRILRGYDAVENTWQKSLEGISQWVKGNGLPFPVQAYCRSLNESVCEFTKNVGNKDFALIVANGNSKAVDQFVRIPVKDVQIALVDENDEPVKNAWLVPTFKNGDQLKYADILPYDLQFVATIPPLGFATFFVISTASKTTHKTVKLVHSKSSPTISNDKIKVTFDETSHLITSVTDLTSGEVYPLRQYFQYYESQSGGVYNMRPISSTPTIINKTPTLSTTNFEARQVFSDWLSQIVRIVPTENYIEFEWTVGPIPFDTRNSVTYGKDIMTKYETGISSNSRMYSDSNGRFLVERVRGHSDDFDVPSGSPFTWNYFPIASRAVINDSSGALLVLVDRPQGGGSLADGEVEFDLHRRGYFNDGGGDGEALNEPGADGRGLVVRGKHRVYIGKTSDIYKLERDAAETVYHAPVLSFSTLPSLSVAQYAKNYATTYSMLVADALPKELKILTVKSVTPLLILLRIEHLYEKTETSVDIMNLFKDIKVKSVQELSLGGNKRIGGVLATTNVTFAPQQIRTFELNLV
uniref:Alpha-mannosidase n=1 Tax=Panagrellus redivivus TaxID=6233 RepID=A0A7E4WCK7_PANRE